MKKTIKIISLALSLILCLSALTACAGGAASTTATTTSTKKPDAETPPTYEPMNFYSMDLSPYITLGQYKDFEIKVEKAEITDADVDEKIDSFLKELAVYEKLEEGSIAEEMRFNADYEGYIDGIQFDGGTAKDGIFYIKDGVFYTETGTKFIDGFAEAVLGASVGDTVKVNTKFPENYGVAEVAGKDAVFYVTVNYICGEKVTPELTDEWVSEYTDKAYETVADFKAYIKSELESALKTANSASVWTKVMENATYVEIPEQQYLYYYNQYKSAMEYYAAYFGLTYEKFLSDGYANYVFGLNIKSDAELQRFAIDMVKEELAIFAVMKAEQLSVTDEEYEEFMQDLIEASGKTREEIEAAYTKDDITVQMLISEIQDVILEINTFVETPKTEE